MGSEMCIKRQVLCLFAGSFVAIGGSTLMHSTRPVPSAQERPALYNPTEPPCFEWDLQKAALERFLAETEGPAEAMEAAMRLEEAQYRQKTGKFLLRLEKDKWPQEYQKLFMMLNYVIAERNAARTTLKTMNKSEWNADFYDGLSNGKTSLTYCQPELTI